MEDEHGRSSNTQCIIGPSFPQKATWSAYGSHVCETWCLLVPTYEQKQERGRHTPTLIGSIFLDSCSRSCGADIICQYVTLTFSAHAIDVKLRCPASSSITNVTHQAVHVVAADVHMPAWYRSWGWLRHSNQASFRRGPACGRHSNSQASYRHVVLKSDPHGPRSSGPCTAS